MVLMKPQLPRQNRSVRTRQYDDALFLVDVKQGVLHELNSVGARIWELCDGRHSTQAIAHIITEEFDATDEQAHADLDAFLQEMMARDLLTLPAQDKP